jgi:hypothetical protein
MRLVTIALATDERTLVRVDTPPESSSKAGVFAAVGVDGVAGAGAGAEGGAGAEVGAEADVGAGAEVSAVHRQVVVVAAQPMVF